ncbi:MAG: VanZ family protein [Candidatus Limnocylindrales bacterium]
MRTGGVLGPEIVWALAFLVVVAVLLAGRRRGMAADRVVAVALLAAYLLVLASLTFFPTPLPPFADAPGLGDDYRGWPYPWVSPRPFETIGLALRMGTGSAQLRTLVGNVVAFVPFGFLLPWVAPRWRSWRRVLVAGFGLSLAIEVGQLAQSLVIGYPWRVADVDDLIANTVGVLVGFGIFMVMSAVVRRVRPGRQGMTYA